MTATLYTGDALGVLKSLPDGIARCCVTSPPYWGLRDYGTARWDGGEEGCDHRHHSIPLTPDSPGRRRSTLVGTTETTRAAAEARGFRHECGKCGATRVDNQLGLERTPEEYVARMVEVFREVRKVLTDDGVLFLNLGDSYATQAGKGSNVPQTKWSANSYPENAAHRSREMPGIKPKDLVGIPWLVAFALRADGWYLRSEIIWAKPNPMPESVTDRPTKAHEQIFLLSKSPQYFWDRDAIAEPATEPERFAGSRGRWTPKTGANGDRNDGGRSDLPNLTGTRNARSVWTIPTMPYPGAHFATFPEELARRCILAGTSQRGGCPTCGKPWERVTERTPMVIDRSERTHPMGRTRSSGTMLEPPTSTTVGWAPTCDHGLEPVPDVVIDPFGGSGTVAAVAVGNGRSAIYIDLNPKYRELARQRIGPMLCVEAA